MYTDVVLVDRNNDIEQFAKDLGFSKLIFKSEFAKLGIVESKDYDINRKLIENKKVKVLVNPHVNTFRDSLHFRSGGIDQVICNIAHRNDIAFGFSLDSLSNPVVFGRIKQNIKLCRKYKVKMLFFSFAKNKYELRAVEDILSLLRVLGMTGKEAKNALGFI